MDLHISLTDRSELSAEIYRQLRAAILDGRLKPGERLPATRELGKQLQVSRNTVAGAYERLTAEGFLVGQVGAGTFVSAPKAVKRRRKAPEGQISPRPVWQSLPSAGFRTESFTHDFSASLPDPKLFPLETWRRLMAAQMRASTWQSANYGDPAGHAGLRESIARHIGLSRSVRAEAADVLLTQGAQQAFDLVGRVLIEPGTCVAVEEPGYPPVRNLLLSLGARVVGIPVDDFGLRVSALPKGARLVHVTPSHQFPTGIPMSLTRRAELLTWAERERAVILEDDYDSEFRYSDRPLEPLQSLDRAGRVIYVGSFSKTMQPLLRLGFLIAPASLQPALLQAKQLSDWHSDPVAQGAMARFIDEGLLSRHVRKAGKVYAARRSRILTVLRRDFAGLLDVIPSAAGLHLCTMIRPDVSYAPARAAHLGLRITTVHDRLILGFGAIELEDIDEGLARLRTCLGKKSSAAPPAGQS